MSTRIQGDASRFRDIVKGKIRQNLKHYVSHGEMIGRKGKDLVSIPIPQLDVPRFRYGNNSQGGVGRGDGEVGKRLGPADQGDGVGQAGNDVGKHILEVDITLEELADIMAEELCLPNIQPKGQQTISQQKPKYDSIRRTGPESLRHFRRTYTQALKRQLSSGTYNIQKPRIIPIGDDHRYRSWSDVQEPRSNAAIVYIMDVSGSMTDEQKHIVRTTAFWIDTWIQRQYAGVERRYIIHDAAATVVDENTFYHTRESGGTRISSAYTACRDLLRTNFPFSEWNVYCFQFSDGDNWGEDNQSSLQTLRQDILPACNLFCYGQVESPYGSGEFLHSLEHGFPKTPENLVLSEIREHADIYQTLKEFLGKGV